METGIRVERADEGAGVGLWNENGLRDPREAGMETGIRAERADEGASAGLGSENELRDPREKGTGGLWMWQ